MIPVIEDDKNVTKLFQHDENETNLRRDTPEKMGKGYFSHITVSVMYEQ